MVTRGTTGAAIVWLLRRRPDEYDPAGEWADWFAAKADLLDAVAADSRCPQDGADAVELAARARDLAAQYRALAAVEDAAGAGGSRPDGAA